MAFYRWTGAASSLFGTQANWIDQATGVSDGVPGTGDVALLAGAGMITGAGSVGLLEAYGSTGAGFMLDGAFSARQVADRGTLGVVGGSLAAHVLNVGVAGSSAFAVFDIEQASVGAIGADLDVNLVDGRVLIGGRGAGANATLALGHGTATVGTGGQLDVGTGALTGRAGSAIVVGEGPSLSFGTLQLLGGSSAVASTGSLVVGLDGGIGVVDAQYGGTLSVGAGGSAAALVLGEGSFTSNGLLEADHALVRVAGMAEVGESGTGSLQLSDTRLITGAVVLGDTQQGQGYAHVQGGLWGVHGDLTVGNAGLGVLTLSGTAADRGLTTVQGRVLVGVSGEGLVTVDDSNVVVEGATSIGTSLNAYSPVSLVVQDGGHWMSGTQSVALQFGDTLSVTGARSVLSAGMLSVGAKSVAEAALGGSLAVGSSAAGTAATVFGTLGASAGGTLVVRGATALGGQMFGAFTPAAALVVSGGSASLTATGGFALDALPGAVVSVTGAGADLSVSGGIALEDSAAMVTAGGTLSVTQGGAYALDVSYASTLTLDQGSLNIDGTFLLGGPSDQHASSLIASGATLRSTGTQGFSGFPLVAIEGSSQAVSTAFLHDTDWTVGGSVTVGDQGGGTLSVQGGTLAVSGGLMVGSQQSAGVVVASAGDTLVAGGTLAAGGTGISAGFVSVAGVHSVVSAGNLQVGAPGVFNPGEVLLVDGATLTIGGVARIDAMLNLAGNAVLSVGTLSSDQVGSVVGQGVLSVGVVSAGGTVTVGGGVLATVGSLASGAQIAFGGSSFSQGGTLDLTGQASASSVIDFSGVGTLVVPSIADVAGQLVNWEPGDAIDFTGVQIASESYAGGTLSLFDQASALLGTVRIAPLQGQSLATSNFSIGFDGHGGSVVYAH